MHVFRLLALLFMISCSSEDQFLTQMEKLTGETLALEWGEFIESDLSRPLTRPAGTWRKVVRFTTRNANFWLLYRVPFKQKKGILKIEKNGKIEEFIIKEEIESLAVDRTSRELILKINKKEHLFYLNFLTSRNKFSFINGKLKRPEPKVYIPCGGENQRPCFRGVQWDEGLTTECKRNNPAYFCQNKLEVFCLNKSELTCL